MSASTEGRPREGRPFSIGVDPEASWAPMDLALREYRAGRVDVAFVMATDVGGREEVPVELFLRGEASLGPVGRAARDLCRGRVLDVGAGAGALAFPLKARGHDVTALEVLPTACALLREGGLDDVRAGGLEMLDETDRFDSVVLLMNGLGLCGTLGGLPPFLASLEAVLAPGGQILGDSSPPEDWGAPDDGRYEGEVHMQLEFEGTEGAPFPFLFVGADRLAQVAASVGLRADVVAEEEDGRYLARLTRESPQL